MGNFCPPESGFRIRIHWPDWIRIQSGYGYGSGSATLLQTKFKMFFFYIRDILWGQAISRDTDLCHFTSVVDTTSGSIIFYTHPHPIPIPLRFEPLNFLNFDHNADPGPAFTLMRIRIQIPQNNSDPDPKPCVSPSLMWLTGNRIDVKAVRHDGTGFSGEIQNP